MYNIMEILPHRYPFLMVDRLLEVEPGKRAVGIKHLTYNEEFFQGHFPGQPIMPGVLMIEAIAQVGACALLCQETYRNKLAFLAGVDKIRFKGSAFPGDTLTITCELIALKGTIGKGKGTIQNMGKTICSGEFLFAITDRSEERT